MTMSPYLAQLRAKVGHDLLILPSAAVAVLDEQNRLLVGKHADRDLWVAPGGLIEPEEFPADAAVRETWEETGVIVELTAILGVFGGPRLVIDYANGDRASYVGIIFRGNVVGGTLQADGKEILEVRYMSRDELMKVPHARWMDPAMDLLFRREGPAHFEPATWNP